MFVPRNSLWSQRFRTKIRDQASDNRSIQPSSTRIRPFPSNVRRQFPEFELPLVRPPPTGWAVVPLLNLKVPSDPSVRKQGVGSYELGASSWVVLGSTPKLPYPLMSGGFFLWSDSGDYTPAGGGGGGSRCGGISSGCPRGELFWRFRWPYRRLPWNRFRRRFGRWPWDLQEQHHPRQLERR